MSVKLRGRNFHYRFNFQGKTYHGVCVNCTTKKAAEFYEQRIRAEVENIRRQKTITALVENYKHEVLGSEPVVFDKAFALADSKPSRKKAQVEYGRTKSLYWEDFAAFMKATYPEAETLSSLTKRHCEAYVSFLVEHGRYTRPGNIASKTIREIISVCKRVCSTVAEDAGLLRNPWDNIISPQNNPTPREVFTEDELERISQALPSDPFCEVLFFIASMTALTEGDICTLKWSSVDWGNNTLNLSRRKTKVHMEIPMLPELADFLLKQPRTSEYVFPEHAALYTKGSTYVSYHVKKFLHSLGIITVVKPEGRRAISVKDLHSMRHVFCYFAVRAGIPLPIVQNIVGHLTPEMTRHYANHLSAQDKLDALKRMPNIISFQREVVDTPRRRLTSLVETISDDEIEELISAYERIKNSRQFAIVKS